MPHPSPTPNVPPTEADYARLGRAVVEAVFKSKGAANPNNNCGIGLFKYLSEVWVYEITSEPDIGQVIVKVPLDGQWRPE